MSLLAVNYHWIRPPEDYRYPGIHPLSPRAFKDQLGRLLERFVPIDLERFELFLERPADNEFFMLTFDDGLREHYSVAVDVLEKRGVRGAFFVNSLPHTEYKVLSVHKLQWMRSQTPPEVFFRELQDALSPEEDVLLACPETATRARAAYRYDSEPDAKAKYLLNYLLPRSRASSVIEALFLQKGVDEAELCGNFYMSAEQIRELSQRGHIVGAHGHTHAPMSEVESHRLDDSELNLNIRFLESLRGMRPEWVSYPYGHSRALPKDTAAFCRKFGFKVGLTTIRGCNEAPDPYRLERISCGDLDSYL
jgi:peptidoglycan/xylan/chitin deacetylase (PgdA/CDA1 family)